MQEVACFREEAAQEDQENGSNPNRSGIFEPLPVKMTSTKDNPLGWSSIVVMFTKKTISLQELYYLIAVMYC